METAAAAVSTPRSACRAALPFRSPLPGRVAVPSRPLSAATRRGLVACRTAASPVEDQEAIPIEKRFPALPAVMDINQIREILPHRFPFLLVDRVIKYKAGEYAVAIKNDTRISVPARWRSASNENRTQKRRMQSKFVQDFSSPHICKPI